MKYEMDKSGIGNLMRRHPGIHRQLHQAGRKTLGIARSRIHNQSGALARSGRVEDLGIRPVKMGEPRMTVAVVFHSRYAMDQQMKTGFLSAAVGKGRPRK